jgi:hypothetical protein
MEANPTRTGRELSASSILSATQEEGENGFSGLPYEQLRTDGHGLSVSCTQEITMRTKTQSFSGFR